jgi:hypothetical protein
MLKRTLLTALAAAGMLAFAASAHAAYLTLGTTNTSNATTTLSGSAAGAELLSKNGNGSSADAYGLYGLLTATSPTVTAVAVRGQNSSTNARGYGVYGSQAGTGTGVRGFAPGGKGVWGSSTSGIGVLGQHTATTGAAAAVRGDSASTADGAYGVYGVLSSTNSGYGSVAVGGQNMGNVATGVGVYGSQAGFGYGVEGFTPWGRGVFGVSTSGTGVYGTSGSGYGVRGASPNTGVYGQHTSYSGTSAAVYGATSSTSSNAVAIEGAIGPGSGHAAAAIHGVNTGGWLDSIGVRGDSPAGIGVYGISSSGYGVSGKSSTGYAGFFDGKLLVTNGCTGCAGAALKIDDPRDPAHKYLQHSTVTSSQQLDVYSGNVRTNANGFATVTMPRWFQALNRSFRYQLTPIGHNAWGAQAIVWNRMQENRFTIRSKAGVEISWQVTAVRHDRYAKAHPMRVVAPKARKDQGKYVHPELYGKPRSEGIGYRKPLKHPRSLARVHKR